MDRHMPWDTLSRAHQVRGPKKVFLGCGGDVRDAPANHGLRLERSLRDGGDRARPGAGALPSQVGCDRA